MNKIPEEKLRFAREAIARMRSVWSDVAAGRGAIPETPIDESYMYAELDEYEPVADADMKDITTEIKILDAIAAKYTAWEESRDVDGIRILRFTAGRATLRIYLDFEKWQHAGITYTHTLDEWNELRRFSSSGSVSSVAHFGALWAWLQFPKLV